MQYFNCRKKQTKNAVKDETAEVLDNIYFSKLVRCEDLLLMLDEINNHEAHDELHYALLKLKDRDIPFEACSPVKKEERLEELQEILDQIKILYQMSKNT